LFFAGEDESVVKVNVGLLVEIPYVSCKHFVGVYIKGLLVNLQL